VDINELIGKESRASRVAEPGRAGPRAGGWLAAATRRPAPPRPVAAVAEEECSKLRKGRDQPSEPVHRR